MTKFTLVVTAIAMAAVLTGSQAMAADNAPLAPGKPAGVQAAQRGARHMLLIGGAVLVTVVGIAVGVATSNNAKCGDACAVTSPST
jgi:hypothetical protein